MRRFITAVICMSVVGGVSARTTVKAGEPVVTASKQTASAKQTNVQVAGVGTAASNVSGYTTAPPKQAPPGGGCCPNCQKNKKK